jgi:cyclic pyranopterin phosphate synthase
MEEARGKKKNSIRMIDISDKKKTQRQAMASVKVCASSKLLEKIKNGFLEKGDCLAAAQVAGILCAKNTPALVPLCHQVALVHVGVDFMFLPRALQIICTVKAMDATGVEMEALAGCAAAALTVYDMAKAEEPGIIITDLKLIRKTGGKSDFMAKRL